MAEEETKEVRGRAQTLSPPPSKPRSLSQHEEEKDFHQRNMEHIRLLAQKKMHRMQQIQEEQQKLEATRERLRQLVLSRAQKLKEARESLPPEAPLTEPVPDEPEEEIKIDPEVEKRAQMKKYYRSRYSSLLKTLQENHRQKQSQEEKEKQRQQAKQQKLKEDLGLANVTSKLHTPTVASLVGASAVKEEDLAQVKGAKVAQILAQVPKPVASKKPEPEELRPEEEKEKQRLAREAAEKIRKRAQENLQQLTEKRQAEARREVEAQAKAARIRTAAREAVLSMKKALDLPPRPRSESPEHVEVDDEDLVPSRKRTVDRDALLKLAQHRRNNAPMITDFAQWKKRNRVAEKDRVFIVMGGYPDIRKAFKRRNWVENTEKHSPCFDLKWTLKVKDIDFRGLQDYQLVNHFEKNSKITTKVGLSHSLRNLIWFNNVDIDTFYPRCFDASEALELEDLITEIKAVKAESILKQFYEGAKIPENVVLLALTVCRRRVKDLDELIDDPNIQNFTLMTPEEWEILSADEMSPEDLQKKKHEDWLTRNEMKPEAPKPKKKRKNTPKPLSAAAESEDSGSDADEASLASQVKAVLSQMKEKFPQFDLNGYKNAWIAKPAGLSRGRGIACFNSLVQIVDYLRKEGQWVVQKYIENPLLILNKKFDIRQWVLVTDFNPLTVWFYESCYLRFGVEDFDITNLQNKYIHLTNNSIVKHSDKFLETDIEGSMWHSEEFAEYLLEQKGVNAWEESIKPKIKDIVKWSLEAAQDMIEHRKNSCELFGYDIMIDENLNPWLIEVNSSPAMDYSTPITKRLVKEVMEDCTKVLVDYGYASVKKKAAVDTGKFTLIYKAKRMVEQPHQAFGLNLVCQGKPLR